MRARFSGGGEISADGSLAAQSLSYDEDVPAGTYYVFASAYRHLPYNGEFEAKEDAAENDVPITLPNVPVGSVEGTVTYVSAKPYSTAAGGESRDEGT